MADAYTDQKHVNFVKLKSVVFFLKFITRAFNSGHFFAFLGGWKKKAGSAVDTEWAAHAG